MRIQAIRSFIHLSSLLLFAVLLAACPDSNHDPDQGSRPEAAAGKTKGIDPKALTWVKGESTILWKEVEPYVDPALFSGDFPDASIDAVLICADCARVDLHLLPEMGSYGLHPADFTDSVRVIAAVEIDSVLTTDAGEIGQMVSRLGISHPEDEAFLVAFTDGTAAFMHRSSGGRVAFGDRWKFEADNHGNSLNRIQARWKRLGDITFRTHLAPNTRVLQEGDEDQEGDRDHLSQAWLSCAEGCCTATAVQ